MRNDVLNIRPTTVEDFAGKTSIKETIFDPDGEPTRTYTGESYVGYDWGVIKSSQVRVENDMMILSMDKRETPKVFKGDPAKKERWFDVPWVRTRNHPEATFANGAVEVVSNGNAAPGFWFGEWTRMLNDKFNGEIDFREQFNRPAMNASAGAIDEDNKGLLTNRYKTTVHFNYANKIHTGKFSPITPADINSDFHTYGFLKTDEEIIFYFEREEIFRVERKGREADWDAAFPKGEKMYLLECIQAGSDYYGQPDPETTPDHLEYAVKEVRIWDFDEIAQRDEPAPGSSNI